MLNAEPSPRAQMNTIKVSNESLSALDEHDGTRLGDWLVNRGLIDRYQLFAALNRSFHDGCRLGDAIVALDYLPRDVVELEASDHVAQFGSD
ncbi:MAG: hypothetical protein KC503_02475 [Myxococcales bacterium]|nr:hypothetical protein [Myxococcales bacterium]